VARAPWGGPGGSVDGAVPADRRGAGSVGWSARGATGRGAVPSWPATGRGAVPSWPAAIGGGASWGLHVVGQPMGSVVGHPCGGTAGRGAVRSRRIRAARVRPSEVRSAGVLAAGVRPSGVRPSGISGVRPSGISGVRPSGPSGVRPSGVSGVRPSGIAGVRPSGISGVRAATACSAPASRADVGGGTGGCSHDCTGRGHRLHRVGLADSRGPVAVRVPHGSRQPGGTKDNDIADIDVLAGLSRR
jgi:hypothetical protein